MVIAINVLTQNLFSAVGCWTAMIQPDGTGAGLRPPKGARPSPARLAACARSVTPIRSFGPPFMQCSTGRHASDF